MKLNTFFDKAINETNYYSNIPKDFLYNKFKVISNTIDTLHVNDTTENRIKRLIATFKNYVMTYSGDKQAIDNVFLYRILGIAEPNIGLYPVGITNKARPVWDKVVQQKKVKSKMESYGNNTKAKWAVAIVYFYDICLKNKIKPFKKDVIL